MEGSLLGGIEKSTETSTELIRYIYICSALTNTITPLISYPMSTPTQRAQQKKQEKAFLFNL